MEYVLVNAEAASFYQTQTDNHFNLHPNKIICNDYLSQTVSNGAVRLQFQPSSQRPVFLAINGLADSPSHQQWELLVNDGRYGDTEFSAEIRNYLTAMNSVQPPPSRLETTHHDGSTFGFHLTSLPGAWLQVEGSQNLLDWIFIRSLTNLTGIVTFTELGSPDFHFFRALQTNNAPIRVGGR